MGHSYGGLVSASFLAERPETPCRGLILSSPNFGISIRIPLWRHLLACLASVLIPDHTQDNRVNASFLTHDAEMRQKYALDRLVHHRISARLYSELLTKISRADQIASRIHHPTLILQAGDDHVVSRPKTLSFFNNLSSQDKELEIYEGLYHEILNETSRASIFMRISSWICSRA
jgi:alpha-beta hydrolase superfamily lysophospholipase